LRSDAVHARRLPFSDSILLHAIGANLLPSRHACLSPLGSDRLLLSHAFGTRWALLSHAFGAGWPLLSHAFGAQLLALNSRRVRLAFGCSKALRTFGRTAPLATNRLALRGAAFNRLSTLSATAACTGCGSRLALVVAALATARSGGSRRCNR